MITSTYRNTTPITAFLYKLYSVLFSSFFACSGANYPPPSPTPPFATIRTWLSDIPVESDSFILNNVLHLNIIKYINDICFVLFCLPDGGYYCCSPCSFMTGCMDGHGVLFFVINNFIYFFHTQHNIISKIQQNKTTDTYSTSQGPIKREGEREGQQEHKSHSFI